MLAWLTGRTFFWHLVQRIGWRGAARYVRAVRGPKDNVYALRMRGVSGDLWCRSNTSDRAVFSQVFIDQQYRLDLPNPDLVRLVVDCGANVGFSTVWFASRFPNSTVVAVEPDPANYAMLKRNVAQFGDRIVCMSAAVWPKDGRAKIECDSYGWGTRIREALPYEDGDVDAISLETLLSRFPGGGIDILKIDIEGGERELFCSEGIRTVLDRVGVMMIELHGQECRRMFEAVALPAGFRLTQVSETTIARRPDGNWRQVRGL